MNLDPAAKFSKAESSLAQVAERLELLAHGRGELRQRRRLAHGAEAGRQLALELRRSLGLGRGPVHALVRISAEVEELALPARVEDELPAAAQHRSLRAASIAGAVGLREEVPLRPARRRHPATAARDPGRRRRAAPRHRAVSSNVGARSTSETGWSLRSPRGIPGPTMISGTCSIS